VPAAAAAGLEAEALHEGEWLPFLHDAQRLEREGALPDAQQMYGAVLERKRERCGADSVPVATSHRDLGRVLAMQGQFEAAEEQYTAAVAMCARLLGEGHPNTACALTDLAAVLREQVRQREGREGRGKGAQ
jgi:tetratricopeptide (TPR) repeat protein